MNSEAPTSDMDISMASSSENPEMDSTAKRPRIMSTAKLKKPINMVSRLMNSQTFGERQRSFAELPSAFVESYQKRFNEVSNIPTALHKIFQMNRERNFSLSNSAFKDLFMEIYDQVTFNKKSRTGCLELFYSGAIELFADVLVKSLYDLNKDIEADTEIKAIPSDDLLIVKYIVELLYTIAQSAPVGLSHLCRNPHLLHLLFSALTENELRMYTDATLLLEEMFLSDPRHVCVDMKKIACLPAVLNNDMPHLQVAHLYHILASAIAVGDSVVAVDSSLQEHDQWLLDNTKSQLNKENQEYLMSFPLFLSKLFDLSSDRLSIATHPSLLYAYLTDNTRDIDPRQLSAYIVELQRNTDHPFHQAALYCEKSARADAFLLLSTLLTGKCRAQMQENILKYNFIRGLEKSVDRVVWSSIIRDHLHDHFPGDQNDGPEATVKIHYLRLIYSIADHHVHRYLLLNQSEIQEIEEIAASNNLQLPKDFDKFDRSKCCEKPVGLLTQIIDKLTKETNNSFIRFWMTRALEAFLRGASCPCDQLFLLRKGLLEELLGVLLSPDDPSSEVIQGHFDLLAILMKDNREAFEKCSVILQDITKYQKLCRIVENNLVDSNMFVRCVILSLHFFESFGDMFTNFIKSSRILMRYRSLNKRIEAIYSLIWLLNIKTLSQENVSCLNTSIIMLLIADINGELPSYLSAIATYTNTSIATGTEILSKLKELLEFWLEHYSYSFKENDIRSLEEVTGFKFEQWRDLVAVLISNDRSSTSSIVHYLKPWYAGRASAVLPCSRIS